MKTKNPKITVSFIITTILALWEFINPTAELLFGIGTKGMAIIGFVVTILSWLYNRFYSSESLIKTTYKRLKK